ncbi:MAG: type II toxin-antitoxin system HicB family antitoxin [Desulfovibrio sp.]|nr:type II toxin-antitoxin system HicB family antitoxin [Desulfovibrio sp.]
MWKRFLFGQVLGIADLISYEGQSVQELKEDFKNGVDDYLDHCKQTGKEPGKPYSGKFTLRIDPELHAKLAAYAKLSGKSLNQYAEQLLAKCGEI